MADSKQPKRSRTLTELDFDLRCIRCGQSLAGLSLGEGCSRCGLIVRDSLKDGLLDPVTAEVSIDVACLGCGYNLRSLIWSGVCPECATPVCQSLLPGDFRFADSPWLKNMRAGLSLLVVFFVASLIYVPLLPVLVIVGGFMTSSSFLVDAVALIAGMGLPILWCVSLMFLTKVSPSPSSEPRGHRLRWWIRVLGLSAPVVLFVESACILVIRWFVGGGTTTAGGITYAPLPQACMAIQYFLVMPLDICTQIGALVLALYLRGIPGQNARVKSALLAFAAVSGAHAAAKLAGLPVSYMYTASIPVGFGPGPSDELRNLHLLVSGVSLLLGLGCSALGLVAALWMRRMVSHALRVSVRVRRER